jgi:hypothetical protein
VYDVHGMKMVEAVPFDSSSLVSPSLGSTGDGSISYSDSVKDVAHSIRTYKGKLFLLVRVWHVSCIKANEVLIISPGSTGTIRWYIT